MYGHQHLARPTSSDLSPLAAEELRLRKAYYSKRTTENLVAVGLVDPPPPDSGEKEREKAKKEKKKKRRETVGFHGRVKESLGSPQQTQDTFRTLNLAHNNTTGSAPAPPSADRRLHPAHHCSPSPSCAGPALKDLHHDEMFAAKGTARRERTFVGHSCAACEEPLEHTLRGERILQLSCGHVAHEACFYEYIKEFEEQTCPDCNRPLGLDPSRGGNLDFENLSKLARNVQSTESRERTREPHSLPVSWDARTNRRSEIVSPPPAPYTSPRDHLLPQQVQINAQRNERYAASHARNASDETGIGPSNGYSHIDRASGRRHDYDLQSMEAAVDRPRTARDPIPAPIVTVRSEFPTLSRSRHQQSLTCLVTIEVVEGNWQPSPEECRIQPPIPSPTPEALYDLSPVRAPRPLAPQRQVDSVHEDMAMEEAKADLFRRVENWHGLDVERFGKLILHGTVQVGKDRRTWQELECYLFTEMLICVKDRKSPANAGQQWEGLEEARARTRCTLKGSILIKRHLKQVEVHDDILTLSLSVVELPAFHLRFAARRLLDHWHKTLLNMNQPEPPTPHHADFDPNALVPQEDAASIKHARRVSSAYSSSQGAARSQGTAPTEYSGSRNGAQDLQLGASSPHVPIDIAVAIPVSSTTQGLKMDLLHDFLRFLVSSLGERDRMGLVTFGGGGGGGGGGMPLVGMTTKSWRGWEGALELIKPAPHKHIRADAVEGANVALDLLMQRQSSNALSHIILISDSSASDPESVQFVVSRAEAAKVAIHTFGLGLTHKADTMVEMSTRTGASYTYVKDWMMLRECLAGCLGALQSTSHQQAKLRLRLPEGSPAKFVKISGALHVTKRATGRDAEVSLGDLRFGDKRDVLVQLAIQPDNPGPDAVPVDPWENIISELEALGPVEQEDARTTSIEELPLLQADLSWDDILRDGDTSHLPRPSLLAITMLPPASRRSPYDRPTTPPIPPHPSVVQRRMELLTSDMLSRALSLTGRGQNDRAQHLLSETRSILKGLGRGGLPPLPAPPPTGALPPTPLTPKLSADLRPSSLGAPVPFPAPPPPPPPRDRPPSPPRHSPFTPAAGIDPTTLSALDHELGASLEWIAHPAVFARDARKAVLQAIGVVSSQRACTFRTPGEALWARRIPGVRRLAERSREWRVACEEERREGEGDGEM